MSQAITTPLARLLAATTAVSRAVGGIRAELQQMRDAQTTCRELRRAQRIIATEGLNLPFLTYLSTDNFRKVAAHFPAASEVDVVGLPASDSRVQRGLAQLAAVVADESAVLAQQVKGLSTRVATLLDAAGEQATQFEALVAFYRPLLEKAQIDHAALAQVQSHAIAYEALAQQVKGLVEASRQLQAPSYDVQHPELANLATMALETLFADLRPFTGVALESFAAEPQAARIEEAYVATTASLQEKGYGPRQALALLDDSTALVGEMKRLAGSSDDILAELTTGAAAVLAEDDSTDLQLTEDQTLASESLDVNQRLDTHRLCLGGFASTLALTLDTASATLGELVRLADEIIVVTVDPEEDNEGEGDAGDNGGDDSSDEDAGGEGEPDGDEDDYPLV